MLGLGAEEEPSDSWSGSGSGSDDDSTSGSDTSGKSDTTDSEGGPGARKPASKRPSKRKPASKRPSNRRNNSRRRPGQNLDRTKKANRAWATSGNPNRNWQSRTADRYFGGYGEGAQGTEYQVGGFIFVFILMFVAMILNLTWAITVLTEAMPAVTDRGAAFNDTDKMIEMILIAAIVFGALPIFVAIISVISAAYCCDDTEFALLMGTAGLFFVQIPMFVLHMVYVGYVDGFNGTFQTGAGNFRTVEPMCLSNEPAFRCTRFPSDIKGGLKGGPPGDLFIATCVINFAALVLDIILQIYVCSCGYDKSRVDPNAPRGCCAKPTMMPQRAGPSGPPGNNRPGPNREMANRYRPNSQRI